MLRRIDQFHSGTASGDAITQQMFFLRDRLRALGYESDIYAEHIAPTLATEVFDIFDYAGSVSELLFVHHSIGHSAFDHLISVPTPLVTVFHSITPAAFFHDQGMRHHVRVGLQQLRELSRRSVHGIADSNHNRKEMLDAGFADVDVIPVRTEFKAARAARVDGSSSRDWLFVGRIAPNKHQIEVVRAFAAYHHAFDNHSNLALVGDTSWVDYLNEVTDEVKRLGIDHAVRIAGKVSDEELWAAYSSAGLFVSMSEHEGFGVPLLEAMAAGLPVVARSAAAVPETMGGAGFLVERADHWAVAALAHALATDTPLRDRVRAHQDRRLQRIEQFDVDRALRKVIERTTHPRHPVTVQLQGPFETSYSLAVLNRELAVALSSHEDLDVSIYATEGPGDYAPQECDLAVHPRASALWAKSPAEPYPDVAIRQMYPPRVNDSPAAMTFQYFGWEESGLPESYVQEFNRHLDGIGVMSQFVADLLRDTGVVVPIEVVGVGVRLPEPGPVDDLPELAGARGFRFLHISAAFPRKGVDLLLRAYFDAFTGADDVSLVLKTYPNPHNEVDSDLKRHGQQHSDPPDVRWIDRDLPAEQVAALYQQAHSYVHPARGEGFGLPVAEAMLAEVPVISVAATGLADFVGEHTAATIPFTIAPAQTHLSVPGSTWVEPDAGALADAMRDAFVGNDGQRRNERVASAKKLIERRFSWPAVADRWSRFVAVRRQCRPGIKVAMVTSFNSRCGIAEYSRALVDGLANFVDADMYADRDATPVDPVLEESVSRTWHQGIHDDLGELHQALDRSTAEIVHVQYNMGFFSAWALQQLIFRERRPVVVTLHRTSDLPIHDRVLSLRDARDGLQRAAQVIVHQRADIEHLRAIGVTENVSLIPIGCDPPSRLDMRAMRTAHAVDQDAKVVGTFGFLLPHKGTLELIRAVAALRDGGDDVRLVAVTALHPDPSSSSYHDRCRSEIELLGLEPFVSLKSEYVPEGVAKELLAACDVIALPYGETLESSSAALRSVLPVGRPIVVSDVPIFDDARDALSHVSSPVDVDELARELRRLLRSEASADTLGRAAEQFCRTNSWAATAACTRVLYEQLVRPEVRAVAVDQMDSAASLTMSSSATTRTLTQPRSPGYVDDDVL